MHRNKKILSIISSAAIFILMEIAALNMISRNGELQKSWMASIGHSFMAGVWGVGDNIRDYFSLRSQNEALARENFDLNLEVARYRIAEEHNKNTENADTLPEGLNFTYTPARIVKMARNSQHNYFIIDKGFEDGIRPEDGVITGKGAIGIVDAVDAHHSFCLSFLNNSLSVSARLGRNGVVGPLSWTGQGTGRAILREIPLQVKFSQGDTVWTSGFSAIFPPDIPIGTTGKSKIINGSVNEIQVDLFQDFASLRYVTVSGNKAREEIEKLEKEEEEGR